MNVYIAASYTRKDEVIALAALLAAEGVKVTSTWHEEPYAPNIQLGDLSAGQLTGMAMRDLVEIDASHAVIFLSESDQALTSRNGRHVEFGYALGKRKPLYILGPWENIFHYLPRVWHFEEASQLVEELAFDPS